MATVRTPRERWIEEGLRALVDGGPDAVRIEVLAKRLGVTKGGFYGHFAHRGALLEAMLDTWERESTDEVAHRVDREGGDARTRISRAGALTFSGDRLLPIDLAIRAWARNDEAVTERLRRVDNRRMALLREEFGTFCADPDEIEARSLLAFCTAIGAHFLAADHEGRSRGQVLALAADLLLDRADHRARHRAGHHGGAAEAEPVTPPRN
ncbi:MULTISPECIES: TetR/AcrR family transcriptional regulator [unclassified Streptomyces]|uniref:TetR/AcrR family transcriptional regulator n=1 Tax=unclassified Streptomyces TaxID=2593676 RepID=UPI001F544F11|nr:MULTISPECIES: TetR/AcrR family transcriptional regulator [unclassified Streptomyces]